MSVIQITETAAPSVVIQEVDDHGIVVDSLELTPLTISEVVLPISSLPVDSVNGQTGVVVLDAEDVGAELSGAVSAHEAAADPHPGYVQESALGAAAGLDVGTTPGTVAAGDDARLSDARTPTAHASTHATGQADALTPADIGAATTAQGAKADTAFQVVNHAADANVARPSGAPAVYWIGTVEPVNALDGDLWIGGV